MVFSVNIGEQSKTFRGTGIKWINCTSGEDGETLRLQLKANFLEWWVSLGGFTHNSQRKIHKTCSVEAPRIGCLPLRSRTLGPAHTSGKGLPVCQRETRKVKTTMKLKKDKSKFRGKNLPRWWLQIFLDTLWPFDACV